MSLHHEAGDCPLCAEKLKNLHPTLVTWWNFVKQKYPDEHLSWTFRNEEEQNMFYDQGKTRCRWPGSSHNKMDVNGNPCAEAWDSFKLRPDGVAQFNRARYGDIARDLNLVNAPIQWAGQWARFIEFDHFALK